ncbi:flagellar export chaperone FliS [Noviherbaspirillum aridicola]|uniref:Flagellar secretion chaperone FliS n=1 Tax=Noviherbaspirillum aridicola TaxID=2849687 RepID=A0ABQ4Q658_9BURK|nr:flagellar export chaperone FliS [Noviherbaspirillum aridicola]GIZ52694.1 flagellar protein FliS [Noviherbaspirillum aridicola]
MFGSNRMGASAYANVGVETGVAAASPHKLVVMLFDGAMVAIASAIQHMQAGNIPAKGQAISKAITIIDSGLRASLDKKVGGEIALNLDALYEYMSDRLVIANIKNQPQILEEVHQLLKGLKDAWESINPEAARPVQAVAPAAADPLAPQPNRLVKA